MNPAYSSPEVLRVATGRRRGAGPWRALGRGVPALVEVAVRQMRPNRLLEFAEAIFERSAAAIVRQRAGTVEFVRLATDHQKEMMGKQVQLARLRVGHVDDDQQQPLRVPPGLSPVQAEFNDFLVTAFQGTADGPGQVRFGQPLQHGIALQPPQKTQQFVGQIVQRLPVGVARVDAKVDSESPGVCPWPPRPSGTAARPGPYALVLAAGSRAESRFPADTRRARCRSRPRPNRSRPANETRCLCRGRDTPCAAGSHAPRSENCRHQS